MKKKGAAADVQERHNVSLLLDGQLPEDEEINVYFTTSEADRPQIIA
jgi:hypothetical protein